jgi:5S rRNA maturation endonuclease (ribonuclease M5)
MNAAAPFRPPQFQAWIDKAKETDIDRIVRARNIKLVGRPPALAGPCPKCGGTDRFSVHLGKQVFNCRGCGAKGRGAIDLVMFLDGCAFLAAVETVTGEPPPGPQNPGGGSQHGNGDARKAQEPARDAPYDPKAAFEFTYHDESGAVLYRVKRTDHKGGKQGKSFFQNPPDPNSPGHWLTGKGCMDGVRRVPYHLPELLEAFRQGETVLIVEGERKTDVLRDWGFAATCNSGGRGSANVWVEHAREFFLPCYTSGIIILPDYDDTGREHAGIVAEAFASVGATVRTLVLPGLPPKGDVVDWVEAGGTAEQLHVLIDRDARPWKPSERESVNAGPAPDTKPRKKRAAVPSEDTLALDFAGRHGDELRFVSFWGKWLKWTGEKWQVEKTLAAFDLARKGCRDHFIAASLRAKTVAAVELLARSDRRLAATTDQWDADPWLFNTPCGTVELMTGNLREHRPQDYITKIAGCAPGREGCPRGMTNAERQAKWRAAHPSAPADRARAAARSGMVVALIPRGPLDLRELDNSAGTTLALYDRLINIIAAWLETLDVAALSTVDGFLAFRLLGPTLESLTILYGKISEQRAAEACDVTAAMQQNLEPLDDPKRPKIAETLELLRRRFEDNTKPKAN